ncbi:MAG: hypothetical protein ILO53_01125 [Clostridia bacterium]|nr:hypothetical protein [Clostridia bacterium]
MKTNHLNHITEKLIRITAVLLLAVMTVFAAAACTENKPEPTEMPEITAKPAPAEPTVDPESFDYSEKVLDAAAILEHSKIQGRTALVSYSPKKSVPERDMIALDYSASSVTFYAYCEGSVEMTFYTKNTNIGGNKLYLSVYVDDVQQGSSRADFRLTGSKEITLVLAENLSKGLHKFTVEKQSEAERGAVYIEEMKISGELWGKPEDNKIFIEFIGDSITTGYGNLWPDLSDGEKGANAAANEYVDGTRTYAVLAAKSIGADYSVVAQQGIGCVIGWYPHTMTETYEMRCYQANRKEPWTFPRKADVVVINLGTNDTGFYHAGSCDRKKLEDGFRNFLRLVRDKNPDSKIVWAYGMMDTSSVGMIRAAVEDVGGSEKGFYFVELSSNGAGGNGHPTLAAHEQNAATLAEFLRTLLNIPA